MLELTPTRAVIVSPVLKRIVTVKGIHATHHSPNSPKYGLPTRIIHVRDDAGLDERIPLDPGADPVEFPGMVVDLSDFDWANTKPFARTSYAESVVIYVEQHGCYVHARFFLGSPKAVNDHMDAVMASDNMHMVIPMPDGFRTPQGITRSTSPEGSSTTTPTSRSGS